MTKTTDPDNRSVTTGYSGGYGISNGIGPQYGLPVFTTVDPGNSSHLNLLSANNYESPTSAANTDLRRTKRMLPEGVSTGVGITST